MHVPAIDPRLWSYLPFILLTVGILIAVPMAYRVWRDLHTEDEPALGSEMFSDFARAYAEGKMSEAEFRRIREKLIGAPGKGAERSRPDPLQVESEQTSTEDPVPDVPDDPGGAVSPPGRDPAGDLGG